MNREDIQPGLEKHGLSDLGPKLLAMASPSVHISTRKVKASKLPIGASRLGGLPDVPDELIWPAGLSFIGQINLSEVTPFCIEQLLPVSGWLYFFYDVENQPWGFDPADVGGWKVYYVEAGADLKRLESAPDPDKAEQFKLCAVDFTTDWTMPDPWSRYIEKLGIEDHPEWDSYLRFLSEFGHSTDETHRLLGHPDQIQNEMQLECQLASNGIYCGNAEEYSSQRAQELEPDADDWQLLFQVGTDDETLGTMWGDCGKIYYWIRKDDLQARQFDKVWLILQCS